MSLNRVLVANRGEIAVRIVKACRALGVEAVVAVSEADRETLAAKLADRVVCIGPPRSAESYLNVKAIVAAARGSGCDAVHPGYGFLAEKPELAEACEESGIKFIGPRPESIHLMGNKLQARTLLADSGIPVVPGSEKVKNLAEAASVGGKIGFPLLFKAAAGGGGRGIKIVNEKSELKAAFETASAEARAGFGDETLYVERYVPNARHIEVQVLGDQLGNVIHLGERDCSLQRRYQKVFEESPASFVGEAIRNEIRASAVAIAKKARYENAGTVEFLFDQDEEKFYFLEMNTRIQVEHPVTEMITGVDLVQEQIAIAGGRRLSMTQSEVKFSGHAIECRITAESAREGFRPCPGRITAWSPPDTQDVRVDSHCFTGYVVPPFYDSLLAKLIVRGENRIEAVGRMQDALRRFTVSGIETTIPFLYSVAQDMDYVRGRVNTRWLEAWLAKNRELR
jgi:acetyl-CoA carboxylase biotin carboxylase subunit